MKIGDRFPDEYFDGSVGMKKDFIKELLSPFSAISDPSSPTLIDFARASMDKVIGWSLISDFSKDFCRRCFASAPDEFFILPTSTTGKYHGGRSNLANCVGGNICHTSEVLGMASKVLHRYDRLVDESSAELLKVSCILHDICKVSPGEVFMNGDHGEDGASLVNKVWKDFDTSDCPSNMGLVDYIASIKFAVANHMHLWRFENVYNQINDIKFTDNPYPSGDLLVGLMLAECDYYSF